MSGIIVSSFKGCGKTFLKNTYGEKVIIKEAIPNGEADESYVDDVLNLTNESDIVFVPSTKDVRNVLNEKNVDYDLFYPSKDRRLEFVENQARKRASMNDIRDLDNKFNVLIDEIESDDNEHCYKHKLSNRNEFIGNDASIMQYITNIQSSKTKNND